jgi:hypothetical protein
MSLRIAFWEITILLVFLIVMYGFVVRETIRLERDFDQRIEEIISHFRSLGGSQTGIASGQ